MTTAAPTATWPGAKQKFALFGEVLLTGIIIVVLSIPIVTIPLAIAVGTRHLMRFLRAEGSQLSLVAGDVREGFVGAVGIGCAWLAATGILLMDLLLVASGALPGGAAVGSVAAILLAALTVLTLWACASWSPTLGWRAAVRLGFASLRTDLVGSAYLLVAAALVVLFTWMLPPLVIPALGCVCFAVTAISARHAVRRS